MDPRKNNDQSTSKNKNNQPGRRNRAGDGNSSKAPPKLAALGGAAMLAGCGTEALGSNEELKLRWKEYFKKHYRLMTQEEKDETVRRLEQLGQNRKEASTFR